MPRTKKTTAIAEARERTQEPEVHIVNYSQETNFEYIKKLEHEELALCFEYLFLLREINGSLGFLRTLKGFKERVPECWSEIEKSQLLKLFRGNTQGFMRRWLNKRVYDKIKRLSPEQMAQWLTYFNISATYREQMLRGINQRILAASEYSADILEWLNEV